MESTRRPAPSDSELEHRFGPHEAGFDFLPLDVPADGTPLVPRSPAPPLPVLHVDSTGPLPPGGEIADNLVANGKAHAPPAAAASTAARGRSRAAGEIWLDGDVILCGCPDCRAPMSVRFWLMVADCWRCGASIELTEEQERQVQRLLAERERQSRRGSPTAAAAPLARVPNPSPRRAPAAPAAPIPAARPVPQPAASSRPPAASARPLPRPGTPQPRSEAWLRHLLHDTPAWLISMLVHLLLLTLLALLSAGEQTDDGNVITLSSSVSREVRDGEDPLRIPPDDLAAFDLPVPNKANLADERQREALLAAAQDARELRLDDDPPPNLPDVNAVRSRVGRADGFEAAVAARDPRLRVEVVSREGGTTLTEAAVARGLRWLANHQNADGSWSLRGFHRAGDCNCSGDGAFHSKSPGTALAMLPFLGAGQTHLAGRYKGTVGRGLRWLLDNQKEDGDLRAGANGNEGMYTHGQAAIVLCEAFAMTGDEALRVPAQKAIDFIVAAQYNDGGWRYHPGPKSQRGDTSVVGWQLMALQSARAANLTVPDDVWDMADLYLDSVQHDDGARYSYQSRGGPTPTMTAEALLCRMYLGWTRQRAGLSEGVRWLVDDHPPREHEPNIYYWYYATQTLHHFGGSEWEEWNLKMRDVLTSTQETKGHAAGSWAPRDDHAGSGGRIYMTALAICTLEVYYRHLPLFRQIELGSGP